MNYLNYGVLLSLVLATSCGNSPIKLTNGSSQLTFSKEGKLESLTLQTAKDTATMCLLTSVREGEVFLKSPTTATWLEPKDIKHTANGVVQSFSADDGKLTLTYKLAKRNSFLITAAFTSNKDLDSLSIGMRFFALDPVQVKHIYCLPFSLPYLRADSLNIVPKGYIVNGETLNNTFSLITDKETYSVSALPPTFRLNNQLDKSAARDYQVGFSETELLTAGYPTLPTLKEGSVMILNNHNRKVTKGDTVVREFLVSIDKNTEGGYSTGFHIGEYMGAVNYQRTDNLTDIYRKSMDYLLNNPNCFGSVPGFNPNYFGSIHSQTGKDFGNGAAYYAMYGNSFTVAALNQYKQIQSGTAFNLQTRLDAVNQFLLQSDILTKEGAYWSMLDLKNGQGYVDQAYRKWIETHATGWITYYLLDAYQISGDKSYLPAIQKTLSWMIVQQLSDGSFPKYFENNQPSTEKLGDIAWVTLSLLKAAQLGISIPNIDLKQQGLQSADWIFKNLVPEKEYFGSFEDVGGVNDSYCPSITARALIEAYKQSGKKDYLTAAGEALSVSLSWITSGYTVDTKSIETWDEKYRFQPAYAQVESTSCYFPCTYTLPALFLAASEMAFCVSDQEQKAYWTQISRQFNYVSAYLLDNPDTKTRFGMEWLLSPFLVFSEWGNSQLCWSILESLRCRINLLIPEFKHEHQLKSSYKGNTFSLFMPEWEGNGTLLSVDSETEPVIFKDIEGNICLLLLAEGQSGKKVVTFQSLLTHMKGENFEVQDIQTGKVAGNYSKAQLASGIDMIFTDVVFLKFKNK